MFFRTTTLGALALFLWACQGKSSEPDKPPKAVEPSAPVSPAPSPAAAPEPAADAGLDPGERDARIQIYLAAVDRACDSGVESSCWFQGIVYARGLLGQTADKARALEYFKRGCGPDLGGPACPELFAAKKRLTKKERAALDALCARGRVDACRLSKSDQVAFHSCNAGVMASCAAVPDDPSRNEIAAGKPETPRLPPDATEIARRAAAACDERDALGCATLALAYLDGLHGLPRDPARAFELGSRSCQRTAVTLGCYPAAAARLATSRSAQETTSALGIARVACERGHMKACVIIAEALERSADIDSRQRGLSFWLMACHLAPELPDACAAFERAVPNAVK